MSLTTLERQLYAALQAAQSHLEYLGYGDSWEREGAEAGGLPERIQAALDAAVPPPSPLPTPAMGEEETRWLSPRSVCQICGKRVKWNGLHDHIRTVHAEVR